MVRAHRRLGGLIGLGGGEFRLPVLMYGIGFDARSAVPLNLLISLVTLTFALAIRSGAVSLAAVLSHLPEMLGLLAGGMVSAFYGAALVRPLRDSHLVRLIAALLGGLGCLMMTEAFLPFESGDLLPAIPSAHFAAGAGIGIGVGLVSSILGVAGGELLIPALILIFGADIKTAGSASILISLGSRFNRPVAVLARRCDPDGTRRASDHNRDGGGLDHRRNAWRAGGRLCTRHVLKSVAGLRADSRGGLKRRCPADHEIGIPLAAFDADFGAQDDLGAFGRRSCPIRSQARTREAHARLGKSPPLFFN